MNWSEEKIARILSTNIFENKYVMTVPNCNWTGYECDLFAVTQTLKIIDFEIKISRSDLKADAKKDKWWDRKWIYNPASPQNYDFVEKSLNHPRKVWKHYYVLPSDIWSDELYASIPECSGVILLKEGQSGTYGKICGATLIRRAKPNKDAYVLNKHQVMNIARLLQFRTNDAIKRLEAARCQINK